MRKIFLILIVNICFCASGALASDDYVNKMGDVVEEISLLNLLRGMYLSADQAQKISELAQKAEKVRAAGLAEIEQLNSMPVLSQLRDELYTALAENPPAVRTEVVKLDNRSHKIAGAVLEQIAGMEEEIKKMLSYGQLSIFWSFIPCIVPEVDFESPVRTGQAAASSRLMPAAELIRNTSEDMWKKHGQAYIDHILNVIEQDVGKMTNEAREDLRRRLVKHAWKIRKLKDEDYLIQRDKLAEELLLVNRERTFRSGFRNTGKIARFFLSPAAARVFPKWAEVHFGNAAAGNASATLPVVETATVKESATPNNSVGVASQSALPQSENPDTEFWEKLVPKSLARLSETPYYDQIFDVYGRALAQTIFSEDDKYVDTLTLLNEAGVILTRGKKLQYYTLTQGEP